MSTSEKTLPCCRRGSRVARADVEALWDLIDESEPWALLWWLLAIYIGLGIAGCMLAINLTLPWFERWLLQNK